MIFNLPFTSNLDAVSLLLRFTLGAVFAIHGYPKLKNGGKQAGEWLKSMGIPSGFGLFAGIVEFFGGIALILGLLTTLVAVLFAIWMAALIWLSVFKIHKKFMGGYELDVLLLIFSIVLAAIGGGAFTALPVLLRV
jgi:putative oxidoreductase